MMQPPKKALAFFRWFCREDYLEEIEGDLVEVFRKESRQAPKLAKWKFVWRVMRYLRPEFIKPLKNYRSNSVGMYKSYITIAWRTFLKSKGYSFINITGLAVGLSACLLIGLYVQDELSYDRFNANADRIYRVNTEIKFGGNHLDLAVAAPLLGETAKTELTEVEQFTRLHWYGGFLVKKGNENIREGKVAWADSTIFDVFTLPMISGNPKTALTEPNSIVITESIAQKYFNRSDVVGETLTINNSQSRRITGVIKDIPSNCHFPFTSFLPLIEVKQANDDNWAGGQNWNTYLLLKKGADVNTVVRALNKMHDRHLEPQLKAVIEKTLEEFEGQGDFFRISLMPLLDIHLHSNRIGELNGSGNIQYVYIFSAIAICILIIAIINFMNLATARSANRAREVGMRKVMGSMKSALIGQFITESFLTCAFAMVLAIAITLTVLPAFNSLTGKLLATGTLLTPTIAGILLVLTIAVGFISGSYPAFYLSAFQPVAVLKGSSGSVRKSVFRNILVVFQFSASVILIAGTLIVFRQMKYIQNKDIGYSREQMLIIGNIDQIGQRAESLKKSLLQLSGVDKATMTGFLPVNYYRASDSFFSSPDLDTKDAISMQAWTVDEDYLNTMEMHLIEGRNFSKDIGADSVALILNESAAKFLGNGNIIDKKLYRITEQNTKAVKEYHIVGIVKDFNFSSLRERVKPLAFKLGNDNGAMTLKIVTSNIPGLMSQIENQWKLIASELPFEYSFMDEDFDNLYKRERQTGKLITYFASLSILISCLGLFGLATFMAEQRTKEIGIRKVMGASVPGITALLSKDFLKLVLISVAIALPIAYYFTDQWLEGFAYRINIEWWILAASSIIAIIIALVTVSVQALKAAMQNPVRSLRAE